jgi:O-acetyl-ADP-ribose deacetylase (regulator of RNase III)
MLNFFKFVILIRKLIILNGEFNMHYKLAFLLAVSFMSTSIIASVETYQIDNVRVHLTSQDITQIPVDIIVNAANKALPWPAGGICRAIYLAAGHDKLDQWVKQNTQINKNGNRIELAQPIASPSFALQSKGIKHIIHVAGPDARIGEPVSAIYDAYKNSLLLANKLGAQSIAFPAISIGIFACDKKEVAQNALKAIREIAPKLGIKNIYLPILDEQYYDICKNILSHK